ncbi:hypothetical protein P378_13200 [Desulforamulus profundi]|uniref:6-carboxy-5,6,7,8-tetrahydropterin synthase n=1 Tax=Desulforamulus profundi TaxID=1383067 RepID=A0A2C6ME53_9FIRM|nr:6-pyruvoyl-tetrahydropterin synthase-related protein [Desulforamulus profundi]PHJ37895.1 hypothetical protein P378_13200 [Desulforamulus profundi]
MGEIKIACLENNVIEILKQELQALINQKKQSEDKITILKCQLAAREAEVMTVERALAESKKIAREIEDQALQRAESTVEETKKIVREKEALIKSVESEIARLEKELELYHHLVNQLITIGKTNNTGGDRSSRENLHSVSIQEIKPFTNGSLYTIKMVCFLNARHFVSFSGTAGPVHAHSWQVQISARVNSDNPELVTFTKVIESIKTVFVPYENTILNEVYPFNIIQPTTENMALYFYNRLEDTLADLGLSLNTLSVWETPTRGIEVSNRYQEFDRILQNPEQYEVPSEFKKEAAAGVEPVPSVPIQDENKENAVEHNDREISTGNPSKYATGHWVLALAVISLFAIVAYYNILFPPAGQHYPWGADTSLHLRHAEYVYNEFRKGNYFPQFFEYSYTSFDPFIYWGSLSYYLLAFFRAITGDFILAGKYFIFTCYLLGGFSCLIFQRRLGLWPATLVGIIWTVWITNLHVAFVDGNLPRVMVTALLPVLLEMYLRVLENRKSIYAIPITVFLFQLVNLGQVYTGVGYFLCLFLFTFFLWIFQGCSFKDCLRGILVLTAGILVSAWWLLPILNNHMDTGTSTAGSGLIPATIALDPFYRFSDHDSFYWGISLLFVILANFLTWRLKLSWARSLTMCGIVLMVLTFPSLEPIYHLLPLSQLTWPLCFTDFASLGLLVSGVAFTTRNKQHWLLRFKQAPAVLLAGIFLVLMTDCLFSLGLLAKTEKDRPGLPSSELLQNPTGWRHSLIDLRKADSSPSFLLSSHPGHGRGTGWVWQGNWTSKQIIFSNHGLDQQYYPFLFRSGLYLGITDMAVADAVLTNPEEFRKAAMLAGYHRRGTDGYYSILSNDHGPYLVEKSYKCLVIGKYAEIVGLLFPEVEMGVSRYIDDYSPTFLRKYPTILLAGAEWQVKSKAEETVRNYAAAGGQVLVDLAGMSKNVLSGTPQFLGVAGEPVLLDSRLEIFGQGKNLSVPLWSATATPNSPVPAGLDKVTFYVPLGLDNVELKFIYHGNEAPVYGYKLVDGKKIGFLGGNLIHQAFLTGDKVTLDLLREILGLSSQYHAWNIIPLADFKVTKNGYQIHYRSERNLGAIVPVVAQNNMKVTIDGVLTPYSKFENLLQLDLPAGSHVITIERSLIPIQLLGIGLSAGSLLLLIFILYRVKRAGETA